MSGLIGAAGSKSGIIGYVSGEWKLVHEKDLNSLGSANFSFTTSTGIKADTFLRYRLYVSGLRTTGGSNEAELQLRWSCVSGATVGYSSAGYYGGRWTKGHSTAFTSAAASNNTQMRVAYLNGAGTAYGVSNMVIEVDNLGVSGGAGAGGDHHGFQAFSSGYTHSTSSGEYGGVVSMEVNNNADCKPSASFGELSCIQLLVSSGNFNAGVLRLYGLVK